MVESSSSAAAAGAAGSLLLPGGSMETLLRRTSLGGAGIRVPCPLCSSVACSSCACFALPPASSVPARSFSTLSAKRPNSSCTGAHAHAGDARLPAGGASPGRAVEPADDFFEVDDLACLLSRNSSWTRVAVQLPTEMLAEAPWLSHRLRTACKNSRDSLCSVLARGAETPSPACAGGPGAAGRGGDVSRERGAPERDAATPQGAAVRRANLAGEEIETEDQLRKRIKMGMKAGDASKPGATAEDGGGVADAHQKETCGGGNDPARCKPATVLAKEEKRKGGVAPTFFLLGDTVHSSCCADQIAASHIEPHALIHYGYSCVSWPATSPPYPILYRYTSLPLNVSHFSCSLCRRLKQLRAENQAAGRDVEPRTHSRGGSPSPGRSPRRAQADAPQSASRGEGTGRGPSLTFVSSALGDGLSLSAALQQSSSSLAFRGRVGPTAPPSTFRPVSSLSGGGIFFRSSASAPLVLVYDVRYQYALPCILQHLASLFLAPSPPSSVSTTPPLSSPASGTPPLHPVRSPAPHSNGGDSVEGTAYSSGSSSPRTYAFCATSEHSLQAAADALAAAEGQQHQAALGDRGRQREKAPLRGIEQGGPLVLGCEIASGGGSRMAVVGNAMQPAAPRELSPERDGSDWRHCSPSPSASSDLIKRVGGGAGDWQPTSLCVALAPSACLPSSKSFNLRTLEPLSQRAAQQVEKLEEEEELDPSELQRRQFSSLTISFASPSASMTLQSASTPGAASAGPAAASAEPPSPAPPPTWLFSLPFSWTPRLVFLGPQLQPAQRLLQQQAAARVAGGKAGGGEGFSVRAAGASLRLSLNAYTTVAGRFVFQVFYRTFDRTVGLAPVLPLPSCIGRGASSSKRAKAPSARPEFVPIDVALGGWSAVADCGAGGRERGGEVAFLYLGPTVDSAPSESQPVQPAGAARFTYTSASHPAAYSFATALAGVSGEGPAGGGACQASPSLVVERVFEGNETLAGWRSYREMRRKLVPSPLLLRLLLRYGGGDRARVLSYDPTFFTGPPNQEHLVQQFQRLQLVDQQREEEDAELLLLSPDTTADEAEDLPDEGSRRRRRPRTLFGGVDRRRAASPSFWSQQEEEELAALDGVGEEEKDYFRASLCILDEVDRASLASQKQYARVTPFAETTTCAALLLLGSQVYGQPSVLAYVQKKLQDMGREDDDRQPRHVVRIAMGEVTPAKLLNFEEVDAACLFGCPELCLRLQQEQKYRGISQLLVLPIDALVATDEAFPWSPSRLMIEADELSQEIAAVCASQQRPKAPRAPEEPEKREEGESAYASLSEQLSEDLVERAGQGSAGEQRAHTDVAKEKANGWEVALRGGSDALQCVLGQDVLRTNAARNYKGVTFGEEAVQEQGKYERFPPAQEILEGLSGVASGYDKEKHDRTREREEAGAE
ncbi:hypothetical protein BESB_040060 [Besnoitia besnoiti]|uniref:Diphthamide biosynthesis protein 2 n=1 Tax=Besnoitia besnoiti TaxID=94643 RepID=A0A2A9MGB6_BESBE|nr:hypothetical protein BESB_040060 [Besnoitia besnoiti]PFH37548.1 hypothetical protein BESB_040060 [Besnoitia besnoiti]